jgi:hypothetical protein
MALEVPITRGSIPRRGVPRAALRRSLGSSLWKVIPPLPSKTVLSLYTHYAR